MRSLLAHLRAFWRGAGRPSQLDRDMSDEMRFHIEMETQRLQQRGLSADEAARQAALRFGGVEKYRGAGRDALGLTWTRGISTDIKLGTRMMRKHPGLTAVALFALSLAIGAGAAYLEFINDLMHGRLPFPDADRIVGVQVWDRQSGNPENRVTADFISWRSSLRSFEDVAAYRNVERNLVAGGRAEPVRAAEMTASAFRIARVPALIGRTLVEDDERPGAPPVAVIGHDLWATRFGAEASVIGKPIRLGNATYTLVGVMPQGFGLPIRHSLWIPLQLADTNYQRGTGPLTKVFGKLAPGITISTAQAELDAAAASAAVDAPSTNRHLSPVVKPYVESLWSAIEDSTMQTTVMYIANIFFIGLLALCGANIATLVFARVATRDTEISVRTALGASRARIAGQLFAEGLVLSTLAAVIGLTFAKFALIWVKTVVADGMGQPMMFWWNDQLAPATYVYAALLAVIAALIVGVIPALKATGPRVQERLKQSTGSTSSGLRFGGVWTGVIMTQVGVTVIFLAIVGVLGWSAYVTNGGERPRNFRDEEYVYARLDLDPPATEMSEADSKQQYRDQMRTTFAEFSRRLMSEPGVESVTYGTRVPGKNFVDMRIEVDGGRDNADGIYVRTAQVGANFSNTFESRLIAGRIFTPADLTPGQRQNVAIVDRTFVRRVLNGQDAIGRQVREPAREGEKPGPWIEIIGVVTDLTDDTNKQANDAMMFMPAAPEMIWPLYVAVHARSNPAALLPRVRMIATEVDPTLRLIDLGTLDKVGENDRVALDFFARLLSGISIVAMILAAAGVYALMAFTVSRRTAEIGIRVALGANPRRIVMATFSKAFGKVLIGLAAGSIPAALIAMSLGPEVSSTHGNGVAYMTCAFATLTVVIITAIACVVPARRALRIQPTDALKSE